MEFDFDIGPAINLDNMPTQFKMTQAFLWHFFGTGEGPALGAAVEESVGHHSFTFQLGPRFRWDIQPVAGLGLYLSPLAQVGYAFNTWSTHHFDDTNHFFNFKFGFEPRLVLGDRGVIYWRVFTVDMFIGDSVGVRWDMLFGGGVTF